MDKAYLPISQFFLVIIHSLFSGMLKGTHTKGMVFARRGSRVEKKCWILHSSFHQEMFSRSFLFYLKLFQNNLCDGYESTAV